MTNQEAIDIIRLAAAQIEWDYPMDYAAAFDKAIEALEQPEVIQCINCEFGETYKNKANSWCKKYNSITSVYDFCSEAEKREN